MIPKPSKPGQMEGPLRRKSAAKKKPARLYLFLSKYAMEKTKNVIAKMGLAACLDRAVRPGSSGQRKGKDQARAGSEAFLVKQERSKNENFQ